MVLREPPPTFLPCRSCCRPSEESSTGTGSVNCKCKTTEDWDCLPQASATASGKKAWCCCQEQLAGPCSEPPLGTAETVREDLIALSFLPSWYPREKSALSKKGIEPVCSIKKGGGRREGQFSAEILMVLDTRADYIPMNQSHGPLIPGHSGSGLQRQMCYIV